MRNGRSVREGMGWIEGLREEGMEWTVQEH